MFATAKYYLIRHPGNESGFYLAFRTDTNTVISLEIPNVYSLSKNTKYLAIENNKVKSVSHSTIVTDSNEVIPGSDTSDMKIQTGELDILFKSRNKFELRLSDGIHTNKSIEIVMLVPSWGRWTEKRLWLIIVK